MKKNKVLLAFSGGLDTTFCAIYLAKEKRLEVHSAIVNTGGFRRRSWYNVEEHARRLGIVSHQVLDVTADYYNRCFDI